MALELKQTLRLSQQLVMTPQLQQAIKLLQLSRLELVELIRTEMEQNPLLEEPAEGAEAELEEAPAELTATLNESIEASELLPEKPPERENDAKQQADGEVQRADIDWSSISTTTRPSTRRLPGAACPPRTCPTTRTRSLARRGSPST